MGARAEGERGLGGERVTEWYTKDDYQKFTRPNFLPDIPKQIEYLFDLWYTSTIKGAYL